MARGSGQLVYQHLEGVSRTVLEKHQGILRCFVRRQHGVYALYRGHRLYYVGLAKNLRSRLHHHLKDRHAHTWDRFSAYITVVDHHSKELEALLLRIAFPRGNKQKGKFIRSEDLGRSFLRAFRRYQEDERRSVMPGLMPPPDDEDLPRRRKTDGRAAALAPYVSKRFRIRMLYKGKTIAAKIRSDGTIRMNGKVFTSPSLAAAAAMRRATANGCYYWHYERAPGVWVRLRKLRER